MARGINKVIVLGHLGNDPEVKFLPSGAAVANMSVAVSESWTDKNTGEKQERTEWIRLVVFGKIAEHCGTYLKKGSLIYAEGKMQTRKWTDQQGVDKYTTEVIVDMKGTVQFLDRKGDNQQGEYGHGHTGNQQTFSPDSAKQPQQNNQQSSPPTFDDFDNIPF